MSPNPRLASMDATQASSHADVVWQVYDAAFGDCDEDTWRTDTYARHLARPDFRLVGAWDGKRLVGFGYGYTGHRGEYWPDKVAEALGPDVAAEWVGGHFELVALAVLPAYQGRRIGARLLDRLMHRLPQERALLSTEVGDTPAVRLYSSRGWVRLGLLDSRLQVMGTRVAGKHLPR